MNEQIIVDLAKSGLIAVDMNIRPASITELASIGFHNAEVIGYVIPYYDIDGKLLQFYRVKLINPPDGVKYRQIRGSGNHIYFPPNFQAALKGKDYILITEGEKKAAKACKDSFPTIALSGVNSWRNRILLIPENAELSRVYQGKFIQIKLPPGNPNAFRELDNGPLAVGLKSFFDMCVKQELTAIIVFDTDNGKVKTEVQKAAASLGHELRHRGLPISKIRQAILPSAQGKVGLDDFLIKLRGKVRLEELLKNIRNKRVAFPRDPNPRNFVSNKLGAPKLSRKEAQDVSLTVMTELESRGRRIRALGTDEIMYFDEVSHKLMNVTLANPRVPIHETSFGSFLYREFNLAGTDSRVLSWLASQFTGELGIQDAHTHKVLTRPKEIPNSIAFQLSDSHFCIVTGDEERPLILCKNGDHGILFEQEQVMPLDPGKLEVAFYEHLEGRLQMHWLDVLNQLNFHVDEDNEDQQKLLTALLFYISPWLWRWKGTQLPIELVIGEAGSGKSSLYSLRQHVLTGQPRLANMTNDVRDWYAGITSRGGMYVLDNVHFTSGTKDYRQRISDELCRITTEPDPHVEMRKLYTTSKVVSIPVTTTFAFTAIQQPFFNTDLMQRAAIFELQAIGSGHDANWIDRQLNRAGGRIGWVAHQLAVIHKFMHAVQHRQRWDNNYASGHRLANYEQALSIMAEIFGLDTEWIPEALTRHTQNTISEADWAMQGLEEFTKEMRSKHPNNYHKLRWVAQEIAEWAETHENFRKCSQLTNAWRLGRYLSSHKVAIERSIGLFQGTKRHNKQTYMIQVDGTK